MASGKVNNDEIDKTFKTAEDKTHPSSGSYENIPLQTFSYSNDNESEFYDAPDSASPILQESVLEDEPSQQEEDDSNSGSCGDTIPLQNHSTNDNVEAKSQGEPNGMSSALQGSVLGVASSHQNKDEASHVVSISLPCSTIPPESNANDCTKHKVVCFSLQTRGPTNFEQNQVKSFNEQTSGATSTPLQDFVTEPPVSIGVLPTNPSPSQSNEAPRDNRIETTNGTEEGPIGLYKGIPQFNNLNAHEIQQLLLQAVAKVREHVEENGTLPDWAPKPTLPGGAIDPNPIIPTPMTDEYILSLYAGVIEANSVDENELLKKQCENSLKSQSAEKESKDESELAHEPPKLEPDNCNEEESETPEEETESESEIDHDTSQSAPHVQNSNSNFTNDGNAINGHDFQVYQVPEPTTVAAADLPGNRSESSASCGEIAPSDSADTDKSKASSVKENGVVYLEPLEPDNFPDVRGPGQSEHMLQVKYRQKNGVLPRSDGLRTKLIVCDCSNKDNCGSTFPGEGEPEPQVASDPQLLFQDAMKEGRLKRRHRHGAFSGAKIKTWAEDISSSSSDGSSPVASDNEPEKFKTYIDRPRILLLGLTGSGKSSVRKVIFDQMLPEDTANLERTTAVVKCDISNSSILRLQTWDMPWDVRLLDGSYESFLTLRVSKGIIYVIDAQNTSKGQYLRLQRLIRKVHNFIKPDMRFDIFIHKVEVFSSEEQLQMQTDIQNKLTFWLQYFGMDSIQLSFHLTSIYDYSIYEAFSKVVQRAIPQLPEMENILDTFVLESDVQKAFLMHPGSKIYFASDSSPIDMQSYEQCCDLLIKRAERCKLREKKGGAITKKQLPFSAKLDANTVMYLKEINKDMSLLCTTRDDSLEAEDVITENFKSLCKALQDVSEPK